MVYTVISYLMCVSTAIVRIFAFKEIGELGMSFKIKRAIPPVVLQYDIDLF